MNSVRNRYLYKLGAGFFSVASLGAIQALALRALGPSVYGVFDFLNTFNTQAITLLDLGTSDCFYTKLSKRPGETSLVVFYGRFVLSVCALFLLLTLLAVLTPAGSWIWPGVPRQFVLLGAGMGALLWMSTVLNKAADAYGLTIDAERCRVIQKVVGVLLLAVLVWVNRVTLAVFFGYWYALTLFLMAAFALVSVRGGHTLSPALSLSKAQARGYALEFYEFSHPLLLHALATFAAGILGRWLLLRYSGSAEQALFGLAEQISSMCALGVSVMTPLLLRELAISHHEGGQAAMAGVILRRVPILGALTAFLACFTALHAGPVARLLGGDAYAPGSAAVMLMSFSAVFRGGAVMFGAVLLASGRTALYRNVGIVVMTGGAVLNCYLLAPVSVGGLHLGAAGLAAQALAAQFVTALILQALAARSANLSFVRQFGRGAGAFCAMLCVALASRGLSLRLEAAGAPMLWAFLAAGVFYCAVVAALAAAAPRVFGFERRSDIIEWS